MSENNRVPDIQQAEENLKRKGSNSESTKRAENKLGNKLINLLFFPVSVLYLEILLKIFVAESRVFDRFFIYTLAFSLACGGILWLIGNILSARRAARIITGVGLGVLTALFITEYCVHSFFKTYFELRFMLKMLIDVLNGFGGQTANVIFSSVGFLILAFVPLITFIFFNKRILPKSRPDIVTMGAVLLAVIVFQTVGVIFACHGTGAYKEDRSSYRSMYSANAAIIRFGLVTSIRLEVKYAVFGMPDDLDAVEISADVDAKKENKTEKKQEYKYNTLNIDFEKLSAPDNTYRTMNKYFASISPTKQNEYTGMFKGKNLIVFTCEAFSPYAIRKDLTPTLYKMQNEGFYFTDYYQPDWTQSTTGGEFAAMSGLIPSWVDGAPSFYKSARDYMPFSLGNRFRAAGYTTKAYHNNAYSYYNRDKTHPNMGYDYKGIGNGLTLETRYGWPESDLEMMKATLKDYVDDYAATGKLFHSYYMTVSGHCNYSWAANSMSKKNKALTEKMSYSEPVKAYLACQVELEYALKYTIDYCKKKGVLDDVVIVMTSDHYPYALSENTDVDYYKELENGSYNEQSTKRYRNALIIWSASMKKRVKVDVPCSSIDLVPTVLNLFGLPYDSRLLSGRDILDKDFDVSNPDSRQPFVVFADKGAGVSWISCAGTYNAYKKAFIPNKGYEDYAKNSEYISAMTKKANNMCLFSKLIIGKNYYARAVPKS